MTKTQEKFLKSRGYRKYEANHVIFPYADFFYQKCVRDKKGKKYFINLVHYPEDKSKNLDESWMAELNINKPSQDYKQHRIFLDNLDKIEENCERFFNAMDCEYYELFNNYDN